MGACMGNASCPLAEGVRLSGVPPSSETLHGWWAIRLVYRQGALRQAPMNWCEPMAMCDCVVPPGLNCRLN